MAYKVVQVDQLTEPCLHDTTSCTTVMFVYTMQPVVKLVIQPVVQPVALCIQTFSHWTNRLYEFNMFDSCNLTSNHARRVYILTTRCTTGWMNYANEPSQAAPAVA